VIEIEQRVTALSAAEALAEQINAAHILGEFVLDDPDEVVLAGDRAVVRVISKGVDAAETRIGIDGAAVVGAGEPERFGLGIGQPHLAGRSDRQRGCGGRIDLGQRGLDRRIAVAVEIRLALAERAGSERLAVYFAVAHIDVDGNGCGNDAFQVADGVLDCGRECRRRVADAGIVDDVDDETRSAAGDRRGGRAARTSSRP